ncbi:MAG: hypothetical protein ACI4UT_00410 [Candidatus Enteromonas sp.]
MKTKAKLILAMSVLTAGVVAAGATGTFAWFTTNRAAQLTYSTVTAMKNAGNLDAYIAGQEASTGWQTAERAESVEGAKAAATSTAATKMSDLSSKDGLSFCRPIWKTISGEGQPVSKHEQGVRGTDYSTFYFKVTNTGSTPIKVYLNEDTAIAGVSASDPDSWAAKYTRIAINETEEEGVTGVAKFDMPASSTSTWLIESSEGTTGKYLPYNGSVADGTEAVSVSFTNDAKIKHFTGALAEVNTTTYTGLDKQMIGGLEANASRYYVVSVWLEGTKADGTNFDKAANGQVNITLDLTAIQVDNLS